MPGYTGAPTSARVQQTVRTEGIREAGEALLAIDSRLHNVKGAKPLIVRILADEYRRKFDAWEGQGRDGSDYMVETGKTRRVWTSPSERNGNGRIRRAHGDTIEYGSTIFYNKFHWRALTNISRNADARIAEAMADYFVPEEARYTQSYVQRRGDKQVRVRSYLSRGRLAEPRDND